MRKVVLFLYYYFNYTSLTRTVGAPAVPAGGVFDGGGGGQLYSGEEAGTRSQLNTLSIQLAGQCHLHGFVSKC